MPIYYRNETLFSEIYLEEITRLPEQGEVLASLKVLREYRDYAETSNLEAWTKSYIHEVLAALGFYAKGISSDLSLLYPMGSAEHPVSLCVVALPDESLDNTLLGRNWAEKTIRALREQGLQWGLLTNGKLWRIYHLDEATPYETYLEIDLESILTDQAKGAYQILYLFMKAGNFTAGEDGKCQFDLFKKESKDKIDYIEKELANALRQREEGGKGVLSDLCMGYVEEIRHSTEYNLDDETVRRKIYHGAMLYMFRLLFLLYAEARGLLSDKNHILLLEVEVDTNAQHAGEAGNGNSYALWERLSAIFVDIDQTYNGGLFSPQESEFTRFIEEMRVADRYLAETLFNLITYHEKDGQERLISYRDMSVRHLGTLYEGLLEHRLFITKEDTEVRVTKGAIEFIPVSRGGKLVQGHYLTPGAVYFGSDPSERKSTGSYYTPEYIVDYIVRNTVGEKLKEINADFLAKEKANLEALRPAVDLYERAALANLLEENALQFVREKILRLSILDPAMGSGHFLVNAANLIANFITEFLNELGIEGETPTSTAYWRRWVVENCIYGVDINPLAVELAKLSLWILSMAKDQPLSFMNHHFKCGNSLMGARLDEIGNYPFSTAKKEPRQLSMFERDPNFRRAVEDALAKSRLIASRASTTLEDVEEKKAWLAEIEADLKGYKAICNVHTGLYFGHLVDENEYNNLVEKKHFTQAFAFGKPNQYFHWELEFLDIFIYKTGFDCVVGNPPYLQIENILGIEREYFQRRFTTFLMRYDIFGLFIERAYSLLAENNLCGMIIPSTMLSNQSFKNLRFFLLRNTAILSIVNLGGNVFENANNDTIIINLSKGMNTKNLTKIVSTTVDEKLDVDDFSFIDLNSNCFHPEYAFEILISKTDSKLFDKILEESIPLESICRVMQGFVTGGNNAYYVNRETIHKEGLEISLCKPAVSGNNISRYGVPEIKNHVIYITRDDDLDKYPNVKKHLLPYQKDLSAKREVVMGRQPWYALHWARDKEKFEQSPKILVQKIRNLSLRRRIIASIDRNSIYADSSLNVIYPISVEYDLRYVLGIMNSKLINYLFLKKHVDITIKGQYLSEIPIKVINRNFPVEFELYERIISIAEELLSLNQEIIGKSKDGKDALQKVANDQDKLLDAAVYKIYGLSEEEIVTVETEG
jgi:type I restriction-modification system DNA methylase subunit